MKTILAIALIGITTLGFTSCKDDDEAKPMGANIQVTVKNNFDVRQSGMTVYMFEDNEPTASTPTSDADKQIVTNSDGLAIFDLNFTELNITESQTTLYFAVFYTVLGETFMVDSEGITVKRNDEKKITLTVPI